MTREDKAPTNKRPPAETGGRWYCEDCKRFHNADVYSVLFQGKTICLAAWKKRRSIFKPLKRK